MNSAESNWSALGMRELTKKFMCSTNGRNGRSRAIVIKRETHALCVVAVSFTI